MSGFVETSHSKKSSKTPHSVSEKNSSKLNQKHGGKELERFQGFGNGHWSDKDRNRTKTHTKSGKRRISSEPSYASSAEDLSDEDMHILPEKQANGSGHKTFNAMRSFSKDGLCTTRSSSCMKDTESQLDSASGGRKSCPSTQSPLKVIF